MSDPSSNSERAAGVEGTAAVDFEQLCNLLPHPLMVVDGDGRLCHANEMMCERCGRSLDALLSQPVQAVLPQLQTKRVRELFRHADARGSLQFECPGPGSATVTVMVRVLGAGKEKQLLISFLDPPLSEVRRLERQLLEISDYEKQRLGRDLHDGLSQQITGIRFQMESLTQALSARSDPLTDRAREIVDLLGDAENLVHEVASGLLPLSEDPNGLADALEGLAGSMERLYRRRCTVEIPRAIAICNPQTAMHLFRIAQEAVSNAMQHADAAEVTISLRKRGSNGVLQIRDDGVGMKVQGSGRSSESLGLSTMRYRARLIGASIEFRSRPEVGTVIACQWQLD